MDLEDVEFTLKKGREVRGGETHYPNYVRLVIPKALAVGTASRILSTYQHARGDSGYLDELPLFGELQTLGMDLSETPGTTEHRFTINQGQELVDGKSMYPNLFRLIIPIEEGIRLAEQILLNYRTCQANEVNLYEIPLFGQVEAVEE